MPSYEYRTIEVDSDVMIAGLGGDVIRNIVAVLPVDRTSVCDRSGDDLQ
jgi:hypothetical protein